MGRHHPDLIGQRRTRDRQRSSLTTPDRRDPGRIHFISLSNCLNRSHRVEVEIPVVVFFFIENPVRNEPTLPTVRSRQNLPSAHTLATGIHDKGTEAIQYVGRECVRIISATGLADKLDNCRTWFCHVFRCQEPPLYVDTIGPVETNVIHVRHGKTV